MSRTIRELSWKLLSSYAMRNITKAMSKHSFISTILKALKATPGWVSQLRCSSRWPHKSQRFANISLSRPRYMASDGSGAMTHYGSFLSPDANQRSSTTWNICSVAEGRRTAWKDMMPVQISVQRQPVSCLLTFHWASYVAKPHTDEEGKLLLQQEVPTGCVRKGWMYGLSIRKGMDDSLKIKI